MEGTGSAAAMMAAKPCFLTGDASAFQVGDRDRKGKPLRTVISRKSGLVYTDPAPSSDELRHFYSKEYRLRYKSTVTPRRKHVLRSGQLALERLRLMGPYLPQHGTLLDVGCGGGELVYLAGLRGLRAWGIEPNEGFAGFALTTLEIPVECQFFEDIDLGDRELDGIALFHVLEHLEDPLRALTQLARGLRPGGKLFVEVPDVDYCGIAPQHRWHLGHLFNFNRQTLAATGILAGLGVVETIQNRSHGVLTAVFQKPGVNDPKPVFADEYLVGSFERTYRVLRNHRVAYHYASVHRPLGRVIRKAVKYGGEYLHLATRRKLNPRHLLLELHQRYLASSA